jgi:putative transposase
MALSFLQVLASFMRIFTVLVATAVLLVLKVNYRMEVLVSSSVSKLKCHHHCVFNIKYHLVLVTKCRRKAFTKDMLNRLESICSDLCETWGIGLIEFGGESDHIHLLLDFHPAAQPSKFVNNLKTVTSRRIRKEFSEHLQKFYWKPVMWTRAYCLLSAGGAPIETIKKYIENQSEPEK